MAAILVDTGILFAMADIEMPGMNLLRHFFKILPMSLLYPSPFFQKYAIF